MPQGGDGTDLMDMIGAIDKWASVLIRSSAKELVGGHVRVSVTAKPRYNEIKEEAI